MSNYKKSDEIARIFNDDGEFAARSVSGQACDVCGSGPSAIQVDVVTLVDVASRGVIPSFRYCQGCWEFSVSNPDPDAPEEIVFA